jgi:glycosyltransferase involved in cell wall biosynthesis
MSDYLIVSTPFIQKEMKRIFKKPIYVIPNSIDFNIWDNLMWDPKGDKIRIVYTGCGNHSGDVEIVKKPILKLLDEYPNLEFIMPIPFESWADVDHPRVINKNCWSSIGHFPQMVAGWNPDIGIAPLRDSNFNRAKSNLRWLEYSALKVPTVASRVVPFEESIKEGKDGILCSSSIQWYEALKSLIENKEKRLRMGMDAYKRVKSQNSMDDIARRYKSVLESIKHEANARTT